MPARPVSSSPARSRRSSPTSTSRSPTSPTTFSSVPTTRPYATSCADSSTPSGSSCRLGTAISELPTARPATLAPIAIATADGGELVAGETQIFALGDVSDADRDMAGIANAQARVVAANVRALITGPWELTSYETFPPMIAIPLGPEGGAGLLGDGVADAATIADLKGRHTGTDHFAALFDTTPPLAA